MRGESAALRVVLDDIEALQRIIDYAIDPSTLRRLIAFYKPRGCIVFAWNGARSLSARNFARIPTVYMDRSKPSGGQSLDVIQV